MGQMNGNLMHNLKAHRMTFITIIDTLLIKHEAIEYVDASKAVKLIKRRHQHPHALQVSPVVLVSYG